MRRTRRPTPDEHPAVRRKRWGRPRRVIKAEFLAGLPRFRQQYPWLTFTRAVEQLALLHRISPRTAWRFMRGVPRPPKPTPKRCRVRTDAERQQIHALTAQGWSARRIGRHLGWDHHTVRHWLTRPADYRVKYPCRPREPPRALCTTCLRPAPAASDRDAGTAPTDRCRSGTDGGQTPR